jgi:hypothetical protein
MHQVLEALLDDSADIVIQPLTRFATIHAVVGNRVC